MIRTRRRLNYVFDLVNYEYSVKPFTHTLELEKNIFFLIIIDVITHRVEGVDLSQIMTYFKNTWSDIAILGRRPNRITILLGVKLTMA